VKETLFSHSNKRHTKNIVAARLEFFLWCNTNDLDTNAWLLCPAHNMPRIFSKTAVAAAATTAATAAVAA
jgi:hypothetical protein